MIYHSIYPHTFPEYFVACYEDSLPHLCIGMGVNGRYKSFLRGLISCRKVWGFIKSSFLKFI